MKLLLVVLMLICTLLAACGGPIQAPATTPKETPLLTDTDIDKAQFQMPTEVKELVGIEGGTAPEGREVPALLDSQEDISTQAVLPNTSGFVYYLKFDQTPVVGTVPYSIYRHDQKTDTQTLIYSGSRAIQSVAGSADGNMVVVSMKETPDKTSDYDIYLLNVSDVHHPVAFLLTNDTVNNTNVSMTADANRIVYDQPVAGKATVVLRTKQPFAGYNAVFINHADPQRHPSISQNGQFITLVRDLSWGNDFVLTYNLTTSGYRGVVSNAGLLEHPSISSDGNQVLWLESVGTVRFARLKNLSTSVTLNVVTSGINAHPFLTADGRLMTYQSGRNIVTKDLTTGQVQTIASSFTPLVSFYAPMWQQAVKGTLSVMVNGPGIARVKATGPGLNAIIFGNSSRTFSVTPGIFTISASQFTVGQPGKPSCRIFTPDFFTQEVTVAAGETVAASVTYESEPCGF